MLTLRSDFFTFAAVALLLGFSVISNAAEDKPKDKRVLLEIPYQDREDLLRVMRKNLASLGKLIDAMANDDFESAAETADKMTFNKKKGKGLARRGNDAFTAMGVQFHAVDALEVKKAAEAKNRQRTLNAMSNMVSSCVACHATFKVVEWPDNKIYQRPEPSELNLPPGVEIRD